MAPHACDSYGEKRFLSVDSVDDANEVLLDVVIDEVMVERGVVAEPNTPR